MATIYGKCGAFLAACDIAQELGLTLSEKDLRQLDSVRRDAAAALATARAEAGAWIETEKQRLTAESNALQADTPSLVAHKSSAFDGERAALEQRLCRLNEWGKGIRAVLTIAPVLWVHWKLARIRAQVSEFRRRLDSDMRALRRRHAALLTQPEVQIERMTATAIQRLEAIDEVRSRDETAGALAELALLDELRQLPDQFRVINDLKLRPDGFLTDANGVPLQSAQIDHLVVGPTGVFVIETKNWSKSFAESGRGHDPYDQVDRAGRLCWVLLKQSGREQRVRSILAYRGHAPPKKKKSYARAFPLSRVRGYITWSGFSGNLNESQVEGLTQFFLDRHMP